MDALWPLPARRGPLAPLVQLGNLYRRSIAGPRGTIYFWRCTPIDKGKVTGYKVILKVTFILQD